VTLDETVRKVTGILQHPSLSNARPDVVIAPSLNGTIGIHGPRTLLDGFVPVLEKCGLVVRRPAPATLLVVYR
jgi:hypothetical protein